MKLLIDVDVIRVFNQELRVVITGNVALVRAARPYSKIRPPKQTKVHRSAERESRIFRPTDGRRRPFTTLLSYRLLLPLVVIVAT
ncbi:hypothetical protein PGB90_001261 [Kerria lacca]